MGWRALSTRMRVCSLPLTETRQTARCSGTITFQSFNTSPSPTCLPLRSMPPLQHNQHQTLPTPLAPCLALIIQVTSSPPDYAKYCVHSTSVPEHFSSLTPHQLHLPIVSAKAWSSGGVVRKEGNHRNHNTPYLTMRNRSLQDRFSNQSRYLSMLCGWFLFVKRQELPHISSQVQLS